MTPAHASPLPPTGPSPSPPSPSPSPSPSPGPLPSSALKLRVALLHPALGLGGAERLMVDVASELAQQGHHVDLFTAEHDPSHCFPETAPGQGPFRVYRVARWLPRSILGRCLAFCALLRALGITVAMLLHARRRPPVTARTWWRRSTPTPPTTTPTSSSSSAARSTGTTGPYDVVICDQVAMFAYFVKLFAPSLPVLFYCHFPDQLLSSSSSSSTLQHPMKKRGHHSVAFAWRSLYRWPLDVLEQVGTARANRVLVNSHYTARAFAETFPHLTKRGVTPCVIYPGVVGPPDIPLVPVDVVEAPELVMSDVGDRDQDGSQVIKDHHHHRHHDDDDDDDDDPHRSGTHTATASYRYPSSTSGSHASSSVSTSPSGTGSLVHHHHYQYHAHHHQNHNHNHNHNQNEYQNQSHPPPRRRRPSRFAFRTLPGLANLDERVRWMFETKRVILSISRYEPQKHVEHAIEALAELYQRVPLARRTVRLVLAGAYRAPQDTAYYEELVDLAQSLGVGDCVGFVRSCSEETKWAMYAACRVVIYTPPREHLGIVPLEAASAGRAVVAANVGGPSETIRAGGKRPTGVCVEPTAAAFCRALEGLIMEDRTALLMGRRARRLAELRFSREAFGASLGREVVALGWERAAARTRAMGEGEHRTVRGRVWGRWWLPFWWWRRGGGGGGRTR